MSLYRACCLSSSLVYMAAAFQQTWATESPLHCRSALEPTGRSRVQALAFAVTLDQRQHAGLLDLMLLYPLPFLPCCLGARDFNPA